MKKSKIRIFVCLMAAVFCTAAFSVNALAYSTGTTSPTLSSSNAAQSNAASSSASSETSLKPLTPDGTGTVTDNVTNEDGKEFFTITTPSKHVFYLVIDRQKNSENVYFLDAVTEKDLLALAKSDGQDVSGFYSSKTASTPEESSVPTASTPTASSVSRPEKQDSSAGIAAVLVGAAVWFFKFRKPGKKDKNRPDPDDYDYTEDGDEEYEPDDESDSPDEEAEQKDDPETSDGETEREDE
jgi:hypothetical protein